MGRCMEKKTLYIVLGVVGGFLLLCCGCGGVGGFLAWRGIKSAADTIADQSKRLNDLKDISLAAHKHYDVKKRMPANAEDLRPHLDDPKVADRIKSGEIEVVWNASFPLQPAGTTNVIYAWETKKGSDGRWLVVDMAGFASTLSDAEYQNKPKAAKSKAGQ
jgi:hypothetical protein